MGGLDPVAILAVLLLLLPSISQASKDWGGGQMSLRLIIRRIWALKWVICVLVGGGILLERQWADKLGFANGWPDAIRCQIGYNGTQKGYESEFIFY